MEEEKMKRELGGEQQKRTGAELGWRWWWAQARPERRLARVPQKARLDLAFVPRLDLRNHCDAASCEERAKEMCVPAWAIELPAAAKFQPAFIIIRAQGAPRPGLGSGSGSAFCGILTGPLRGNAGGRRRQGAPGTFRNLFFLRSGKLSAFLRSRPLLAVGVFASLLLSFLPKISSMEMCVERR